VAPRCPADGICHDAAGSDAVLAVSDAGSKAAMHKGNRLAAVMYGAEYDDRCLRGLGQGRGVRGVRPGLQILNRRPLPPFRNCLRFDPKLPAQCRERSLRPLYCCLDDVLCRAAS